ncbi:type IIL restriction-modification enzyme MmeI [Flavobacterium sp. UW10123]|uniref:type IIL restriction-modification enzyme MmeI n=1 Tax=Flavobacterium sp. UW10123 TaxID=3230800 RepID=UPI003393144B
MNDVKKITDLLQGLKFSNFDQYVYDLLSAFQIPNNTIVRSLKELNNSTNGYLKIYKRAYIVNSDSIEHNLSDNKVFDKLHLSDCRLIIIITSNSLICKDNLTDEVLRIDQQSLIQNLYFYFPLIYGSAKKSYDVTNTVGLAELLGELYNELSLSGDKSLVTKRDKIASFIISLVQISFCRFFTNNEELRKILASISIADNVDYKDVIKNIFNSITRGEKNIAFYSKLPTWSFIDNNEAIVGQFISKNSFSKIHQILLYDLEDVSVDVLMSLIYKFAETEDSVNIYGNYTSLENVSKVLEPLFVNHYRSLIYTNKYNQSKLTEIRTEILNFKFLDPTNGPGCFLVAAFNSVVSLLEEIEKYTKNSNYEINISNFHGIVSTRVAHDLSRLSLWIISIQRKKELTAVDLTKNYTNISIILGQSLELAWEQICSNNDNVYIIGSPTFKGSKKLSALEKKQMGQILGTSGTGKVDFSCTYLYKAMKYLQDSKSQCSFVITNSVCQGAQVSFIWNKIFGLGGIINFAHLPFKWKNNISLSTGVTVIVVGISAKTAEFDSKYLYTGSQMIEMDYISPYLVTSSKVIVEELTTPLSKELPKMPKGNMPYDNQYLMFSKEEKDSFLSAFPEAKAYIKKIVGSNEFIKGIERYCLWITDNDLEEAMKIPEIAKRVRQVRDYRLSKSDKSAQKLANRAHQFREFKATSTQTLVIPSVSSENRPYIPIGFIGPKIVVSNLAFTIYDCEAWVFGLLSSRMHMIWIRTVCGALESRIRYSSRLGYNTFPTTEYVKSKKEEISAIVYNIIAEREKYCHLPLGKLYNDLPAPLRKLHLELDNLVDYCYQDMPFENDLERLKKLFDLYEIAAKHG